MFEKEIGIIRELDRLYAKAERTNAPKDWLRYHNAVWEAQKSFPPSTSDLSVTAVDAAIELIVRDRQKEA